MDSQKLLGFIYYASKFLVLTAHSIDLKTRQVRKPKVWGKTFFIVVRMVILGKLLIDSVIGFEKLLIDTDKFNIMKPLQDISLTAVTLIIFTIWTFTDAQTSMVLKKFLKVQQAIAKKVSNKRIFNSRKFVYMIVSKLVLSYIGGVYHAAIELGNVHNNSNFVNPAFVFFAVGIILLTDICFLGFLVIEIFYEQMNVHLRLLCDKVRSLHEHHFSRHRQMCVLCEASDELDDCSIILSDIYRAAKSFCSICQSILFFCVFYNFNYILMHLNECFSDHKIFGKLPWCHCVEAVPNIVNLFLFILCVNAATRESRRMKLIEFDIVCSGMDSRWDESVELFLNQQHIESLHVRVFGLFELNNEFTLLVLSSGIAYLFLIIKSNILWKGMQDTQLMVQT